MRRSTCACGTTSGKADKRCRTRYRGRDSRGRLPGKRHICEPPAEVETRAAIGHWEIDTIKGDSQGTHSALTVVERTTGYLQMGKLVHHCAAEATARTVEIIERQPEGSKTITADKRHGVPQPQARRGRHGR